MVNHVDKFITDDPRPRDFEYKGFHVVVYETYSPGPRSKLIGNYYMINPQLSNDRFYTKEDAIRGIKNAIRRWKRKGYDVVQDPYGGIFLSRIEAKETKKATNGKPRAPKRYAAIATPAERDLLDEIERMFKNDPAVYEEIAGQYALTPPEKRLAYLNKIIDDYRGIPGDNGRIKNSAANVDLSRYVGKWYEMASLPFYWERGCSGATAEYVEEKGHVSVTNTCIKPGGEMSSRKAKAFKTGKSNVLKVQFFPLVKADYIIEHIEKINGKYEFAIVGSNNKKTLWFLSRSNRKNDKMFDKLRGIARKKGYDVDQLIRRF